MTTPDSGSDAQATPPVWFNAWTNGTFTTVANAVNDQRVRLEGIEAWKNQVEALFTRQNLATAPATAPATPKTQTVAQSPQPLIPGLPDQPTTAATARKGLSPKWLGLFVGLFIGVVVDIAMAVGIPPQFKEAIPGILTFLIGLLLIVIFALIGHMVGSRYDSQ